MNLYRVNGITIDEDSFKYKIINALSIYKFASLEQLVVVLKAKPRDINEVLDDIIISYIKGNPGKSYIQVCKDLNVKSDFIEELIEEGRLEVQDVSFDSLKQMEEQVNEITDNAIHDMKNREIISSLQNGFSQPQPERENGPRFHTSDIFRRR